MVHYLFTRVFFTLTGLSLAFPLYSSQTPESRFVVVVDPGHGGEDCGAARIQEGKKICEKDLVLEISNTIKKQLENKKIKVILTRDGDKTLTLEQRAEIAEKYEADLFISVHINAHTSHNGNGFETFYLDNHKDKAIAKLEAVENASYKKGEKIIHDILNDFIISRTAPSSKKLASSIHERVGKSILKYKREDRGIKPGLFYVLALTKRPAVLLEAGFISNPKEARVLLGQKYKQKYASGVVRGIRDYLDRLEKEDPSLEKVEEVPLF